ncbi:matrix metalloproteinase-20-like [Ambystoma mexicanum]|uniref:matrix metalloproteinase-20-like n=1 Tax=Ambystoma mexicanum TaxID=8296 RepID=UPI0037E83DB7
MGIPWAFLLALSHWARTSCSPLRTEVRGIRQQDLSFAETYLQQFYSLDRSSPQRRKRYIKEFSSRIKRMQDFFGLNVTGFLDPETLSHMKDARCGVPDVQNYGFHANKPKWQWNTLTYRVLNYTDQLKPVDVDNAIEKALQIWSDVTPLTFARADKGDADIMITFASKGHGDFFPFDGPRGVLAHAYEPGEGIGGDVHLDEEEFWTMGYVKKGYDLFNVVAHELGHALGLGHSKDPNALMYPKYKYFDPSTYQLSLDDVVGIQSLYGPRSGKAIMVTVPEKCNPIFSLDAATTFGSGLLFIKDGYMWLRNPWGINEMEGFSQSYFPKMLSEIKAAYEVPFKRATYLFTDYTYWAMNTLTMEMSSSSITDFGFSATATHVDAAVYISNLQKTLFFVGQEYWSFDEIANLMEMQYPKQIHEDFPGINSTVNAAFELEGILYLFVGPQSFAYNYDEKQLLFTRPTNAWLGCQKEETF